MATIHLPIQIWLFLVIPQVTYLYTKNEGELKIFIPNFASLSWRIALNVEINIATQIVGFWCILYPNWVQIVSILGDFNL